MFGKFSIKPSTESMIFKEGEIDGKKWDPVLSAGAQQTIYHNVMKAMRKLIAGKLMNQGKDKEYITAKVDELLNLFVQNGDTRKEYLQWINEEDEAADIEWHSSTYADLNKRWNGTGFWTLLDYVGYSVKDESKWGKEFRDKMNDREKALVKAVRDAQKALWKAEEEYNDYVFDTAVVSINEMLIKYGEFLRLIDNDWYSQLMEGSKYYMDRVEKRRAERKAEEEASQNRPTESK